MRRRNVGGAKRSYLGISWQHALGMVLKSRSFVRQGFMLLRLVACVAPASQKNQH